MGSGVQAGERGASLLELLTATAIFATLLGVGIPNLVTLRAPYTLSAAVRQVAADLQLARQRAVARNARYRITFNGAAATYTLEREASPNSFVADSAVQPLPKGSTLGTVTPGNPVFDTRGMLAADVAVPITVTGAGTRTVTVNVLGRTTIN